MAGLNGRGPRGEGPRTGFGRGRCRAPDSEDGGWGRGFGRGRGRGGGRGRGWRGVWGLGAPPPADAGPAGHEARAEATPPLADD
ncbi:MAG: DUF5320 domain-containing protein [Acidobacteria bacterium]|nr:DUF5320 domain-containing protein [Acidobacteriota bacterium]